MTKHTLDATNKKPGRLATEVAVLLMGKNRTDFARNRIPDVEVEVMNAGAMSLDAKKLQDKNYYSHSGYPGSLKTLSMTHIVESKGKREVLRRAISGMLPKNKLRAQMLKRLVIKE